MRFTRSTTRSITRPILRRLAITSLSIVFAFAVSGCDDGTGSGSAGEPCSTKTFRCATPACSAFPENPGCDDVSPTGGRCPLDHPHCFDPSMQKGYCDGSSITKSSGQVCAKRKAAAPMSCPATTSGLNTACSTAIMQCADIDTAAVFCRGGYECVKFNCEDGGVPQGDMSMPAPDLAGRD